MYRPPYLQPGDQVAVISPAGAIEPAVIEEAVKTLRSWELEPVIGKHAAAKYGYFAGNDNQRAEDMQWALDTEDIRAIFCTRGGYGSMRIVEQLDYSIFQGSPEMVGWIERHHRLPRQIEHSGNRKHARCHAQKLPQYRTGSFKTDTGISVRPGQCLPIAAPSPEPIRNCRGRTHGRQSDPATLHPLLQSGMQTPDSDSFY